MWVKTTPGVKKIQALSTKAFKKLFRGLPLSLKTLTLRPAMKFLIPLKNYRFRILACVLLVLFLVSTWFMFLTPPSKQNTQALYLNLQTQLKSIIQNRLYKKNPALVKELNFQSMITKPTEQEHQLQTLFSYSFTDEGKTNTLIRGFALMQKDRDHFSGKRWLITQIAINNTRIDFKEPVALSSEAPSAPNIQKPASPAPEQAPSPATE